jgi:hypothetical protein
MRTNLAHGTIVALAAVVALASGCAPPVSSSSVMRKSTTTLADPVPGYVRMALDPLAAYSVVVDATAGPKVLGAVRDAAREASDASGIDLAVHVGGAGAEVGFAEIVVGVGMSCGVDGEAGCATLWGYDGGTTITGARITISPSMVNHRQLWQTVAHELGHALGLEHVDTDGYRPQVMGNRGEVLDTYQSGDRAGLMDAGHDAVRHHDPGVGPAVASLSDGLVELTSSR